MTRPMLAMLYRRTQASAGFTLLEFVVVLVLLGIVAVYVAPRSFDTGALTLDSQARTLASDLQRAQMLATTQEQPVLVCVSSTVYMIQIGGSCPATLPTQDQNTLPVVVVLSPNAVVSVSPTPVNRLAMRYDSMGKPTGKTDFQLQNSSATATSTVSVAALSGLVSIAKP